MQHSMMVVQIMYFPPKSQSTMAGHPGQSANDPPAHTTDLMRGYRHTHESHELRRLHSRRARQTACATVPGKAVYARPCCIGPARSAEPCSGLTTALWPSSRTFELLCKQLCMSVKGTEAAQEVLYQAPCTRVSPQAAHGFRSRHCRYLVIKAVCRRLVVSMVHFRCNRDTLGWSWCIQHRHLGHHCAVPEPAVEPHASRSYSIHARTPKYTPISDQLQTWDCKGMLTCAAPVHTPSWQRACNHMAATTSHISTPHSLAQTPILYMCARLEHAVVLDTNGCPLGTLASLSHPREHGLTVWTLLAVVLSTWPPAEASGMTGSSCISVPQQGVCHPTCSPDVTADAAQR